MAASTDKTIEPGKDVISRSTLLHEAIPITGSLVSGTYIADANVKNFSHGMFQSVYDYPYLSSSANHLFDITFGYSSKSPLSSSSNTQNAKKINMYNQMAQVLVGYDATGSILQFDEGGEVVDTGTKMNEVCFLNFSRLLMKDEIKKGTFELELGVTSDHDYLGDVHSNRIKITDVSGSDGYKVNSPAGEYGILYATASAGTDVLSASLADDGLNQPACGLLYYQAGIAVLSGSVFTSNVQATAVSAIDTDTVQSDGADSSFTITITEYAGGESPEGAVTILLDEDKTTAGSGLAGAANQISIGCSGRTDAEIADRIVAAINGDSHVHVVYATSGLGQSGVDGITAALTTGETKKITFTMDTAGDSGNITAFASVGGSATNVVKVTDFTGGTAGSLLNVGAVDMSSTETGTETISDMLTGSSIEASADALRNRIYNIQFNNTTELNSTIYFCRVNHNEFNYSTNPTYTSGSQIVVKDNKNDLSTTYITTVGLYNANNELLAVAKTSEPLVKTPEDELTIRVRLDY